MFVSNFYSFPRVKEFFGEMSKVKEESKIIPTEKGETFTFPFYMTKPSLLILSEFTSVEWRGKLPCNLPPSFVGLFYSFQHFIKVKIIWKSEITGEIGFTEKELVFQVLNNKIIENTPIGMINDITIIDKERAIDELFPDDLILEEAPIKLIEEIKRIKSQADPVNTDDHNEYSRSLIEADRGYHRSLSVDESLCIATVHLRKSIIQPGTQLIMAIELASNRIDLIKLKLDCIEIYPIDLLKQDNSEEISWRESVKEMKIVPGNRDKLEIVFPIPPELPPSISCKFVTLKWELLMSFMIGAEEFNLNIPLKFISFNLKLNKNS